MRLGKDDGQIPIHDTHPPLSHLLDTPIMFGGPPPPPSAEELRQQEVAASATLYSAGVMCVLLYLSPFAADYVKQLI
ncbi:hypothetical protein LTR86_000437 [Recurvomyces mirabilis]|nr:hypothetical protein LTR86_000437 [Recurvomyces mirabilis]